MSDDLTQKLPTSQDGMLAQILTTVQNLSTQMESLEQKFEGLERRFGSLEQKVENLEQRFEGLEQRFEGLELRFGSLEQKVEERLYDTRPIWEKVQADIARLQEGQDALRSEVVEMNKEQRNMGRKFSVLNDGLLRMQADYRDIDERVRGLEGQRS
jgi:chromosome segregation ATPase